MNPADVSPAELNNALNNENKKSYNKMGDYNRYNFWIGEGYSIRQAKNWSLLDYDELPKNARATIDLGQTLWEYVR